jgi:two-component system heavy metal sensor histidine kinase CusS
VRLEVENTGPAIAPEALPRIFDRFFRVDTVRCTAEGAHHGLGLAIVAAIARMHRGEPLASSGEGLTRVGFSLAAA